MKGILALIGIIAVVLVVAVLFFAGFITIPGLDASTFGAGDTNPENPNTLDNETTSIWTNLELSDREHHQIMSFLTGSSPPFAAHQIYIQGLHMTSYGTNEPITGYSVLTDYEEKYASEGFISYSDDVTRGPGWTAYSEVWYRDDGMGRAIVVGEGASVQNAYGYDVTLTTTYGPLTTYYDYISFLSRY
jgi:hypothetical protein